jgi:hypothetical protein
MHREFEAIKPVLIENPSKLNKHKKKELTSLIRSLVKRREQH